MDELTTVELMHAVNEIERAMDRITPEQVLTEPGKAEIKAEYRRYLKAITLELESRRQVTS